MQTQPLPPGAHPWQTEPHRGLCALVPPPRALHMGLLLETLVGGPERGLGSGWELPSRGAARTYSPGTRQVSTSPRLAVLRAPPFNEEKLFLLWLIHSFIHSSTDIYGIRTEVSVGPRECTEHTEPPAFVDLLSPGDRASSLCTGTARAPGRKTPEQLGPGEHRLQVALEHKVKGASLGDLRWGKRSPRGKNTCLQSV